METRAPILDRVSIGDGTGMHVQRYSPERQQEWDQFARGAKNATFLFQRGYMEYHQDRFHDFSLMVYRGTELVALLPANLARPRVAISHEGLTYGGLVLERAAALADVLAILQALLRHLHESQVPTLLYKRLPGFYNTIPDDDVLYAFFLLGAQLYRRDCALVIDQRDRLPASRRRLRALRRADRSGLRIVSEPDFGPFWEQVLVPQLGSRYRVQPTHSVEEIQLLASRFPEQIRQFSVYAEGEILAGVTVYETPTVAHAQYIAALDRGRQVGALDYLMHWLIHERYRDRRYFDFGICNEQEGRRLNQGLLEWKEGFGARTWAHDFYELATADFDRLDFPALGRQPPADDRPEWNVALPGAP